MIRTFVAIELPKTLQRRIGELQDHLKQYPARVTWVKPENIHLTLKFLGNVPEGQLQALVGALEKAVKDIPSFKLSVSGTGAFPDERRPRVLWIAAHEETGVLQRLYGKIEEEFQRLGFERERRPYTPHLTIGRVKGDGAIGKVVTEMKSRGFETETFVVREVVLMKSDLKPTGAEYTPLKKLPLSEEKR